MTEISLKLRDRNRYRKMYPSRRFKPSNEYSSMNDALILSDSIVFSNSDSETFIYPASFLSTPEVIVTSVDSEANDSANINVFISSTSMSGFTVESSAKFTGRVNFVAVGLR